jgi:hypothetical protein
MARGNHSPNDVDTAFPVNGLFNSQHPPVKIQFPNHSTMDAFNILSHTLQPSHSLLTEDRVFIPRTCSTCLAEPFATATALPDFTCPRSLVRLLRIMCEKGRNEAVRGVTEGRNWRRVPEEAPKTERRENMAAGFDLGLSSRKVINWRLRLKYHPMKNETYRGGLRG